MELVDRFRGCLLGLAIGDALGHPTEFIRSVGLIRAKYGPQGVTGFQPVAGRHHSASLLGRHPAGTFSDDTQMAIAVARSLAQAGRGDLDALMTVMGHEFVAWSRSPENNRSPGETCMAGCRNFAAFEDWRTAGLIDKKGCGAAMRAAPVGLYYYDDDEALVRVAAAQSVLTHRHPTGVASSVAAAAAVAWVTRGNGIDGLVQFTRDSVLRLTPELLLELGCSPDLVGDIGISEMLRSLDQVNAVQEKESIDACEFLGGGWIGEEAVACALWCVLRAKGAFRESVLRGANTSGDSDSIACIAGSIAGALVGNHGLPDELVSTLEKSEALDSLARLLHDASRAQSSSGRLPSSLDFFGADARHISKAGHDG